MPRLLFRNLPLYGWSFAIAWCAISVTVSIVFFRKQSLNTDPTDAISLLFLLVAPWILANFLKVPIISVWDSGKDDWLIARRWLWKVEMEPVLYQSLPMPLIEERDNEGGVKYRCLLRLTSRVIEFEKYRRREQAELACNHQQHHLVALLLGAACRHFLGLTLCRRDTASMPQER